METVAFVKLLWLGGLLGVAGVAVTVGLVLDRLTQARRRQRARRRAPRAWPSCDSCYNLRG